MSKKEEKNCGRCIYAIPTDKVDGFNNRLATCNNEKSILRNKLINKENTCNKFKKKTGKLNPF